MRIAIAYALHHPELMDAADRAARLEEVGTLKFEAVDHDAFPCLRLALEAAKAGGTAPCVLNAANEVAVHAFLAGGLDFLGIPAVIESTLDGSPAHPCARSSRSTRPTASARGGIATEQIAIRA